MRGSGSSGATSRYSVPRCMKVYLGICNSAHDTPYLLGMDG